jgi:uncharacterized protein YciI
MWYAVISEDRDSTLDLRLATRPDHVARLKVLCNEGRLLIAGPHPAVDSTEPGPAGFTGCLVVADFPTLEEAEAWVNEDPYVTAGVYRKVTVKPFIRVLP